jgi:hypothetical protein
MNSCDRGETHLKKSFKTINFRNLFVKFQVRFVPKPNKKKFFPSDYASAIPLLSHFLFSKKTLANAAEY